MATNPTAKLITTLEAEVGKAEKVKESTVETRALLRSATSLAAKQESLGLSAPLVNAKVLEEFRSKVGETGGSETLAKLVEQASAAISAADLFGVSKAQVTALSALVERAGKARTTRGGGGRRGDGSTMEGRNMPLPLSVSCTRCKATLTTATLDWQSNQYKVKVHHDAEHKDVSWDGVKANLRDAKAKLVDSPKPGKTVIAGFYTLSYANGTAPAAPASTAKVTSKSAPAKRASKAA